MVYIGCNCGCIYGVIIGLVVACDVIGCNSGCMLQGICYRIFIVSGGCILCLMSGWLWTVVITGKLQPFY